MKHKISAVAVKTSIVSITELNRILTAIAEEYIHVEDEFDHELAVKRMVYLSYQECQLTSAIVGVVLEALDIPYVNVCYSDHVITEFYIEGKLHIACMSYKQFLLDTEIVKKYNLAVNGSQEDYLEKFFPPLPKEKQSAVMTELISYVKGLPLIICAEKNNFFEQLHKYREKCEQLALRLRLSPYKINPEFYKREETDKRYGVDQRFRRIFPDDVTNLKKLVRKYGHDPLTDHDQYRYQTSRQTSFFNVNFVKRLPQLIHELTGMKLNI